MKLYTSIFFLLCLCLSCATRKNIEAHLDWRETQSAPKIMVTGFHDLFPKDTYIEMSFIYVSHSSLSFCQKESLSGVGVDDQISAKGKLVKKMIWKLDENNFIDWESQVKSNYFHYCENKLEKISLKVFKVNSENNIGGDFVFDFIVRDAEPEEKGEGVFRNLASDRVEAVFRPNSIEIHCEEEKRETFQFVCLLNQGMSKKGKSGKGLLIVDSKINDISIDSIRLNFD